MSDKGEQWSDSGPIKIHISGIVKPSWRANVHGETIFRRCHIFPAMASSNQTPAGGDWGLSVKHALRSYPVFEPILIIIRLQNPDNTSKASKSLPNSRLKNLFQTSKSRQKSSFKFYAKLQLILTNLQPQHHDQTSVSMLWPKWGFKISTKPQLQNLDQTVSSSISNTNNIKMFWVGIFKGQSHIGKVLTTWASLLVTRRDNDKTWVC